MTDNNRDDEKDDEKDEEDGTVDLRLTIPDTSRRRLRALAALYGCTMADLVDSLIAEEWHGSEAEAEEHYGRRWYDGAGALRNPDGSLYRGRTHAEERAEREAKRGGAR